MTVCEFGVARGAGLMNLIELAEVIAPATGVTFRIVGFDTGAGLPPVTGHKNHPEIWAGGDFSMIDPSELIQRIAGRAELILGDVDQTVEAFTKTLTEDAPLGWISIDVDTYSGTVSALRCLNGRPEQYTPAVGMYLDDIGMFVSNRWCGELAAIEEFNRPPSAARSIATGRCPGDRPTGPVSWHSKCSPATSWTIPCAAMACSGRQCPSSRAPRTPSSFCKPATLSASRPSGPIHPWSSRSAGEP